MQRLPFDPRRVIVPPRARAEKAAPLTVSQLTALVRQALSAALPPTLHVVGQIGNYKRHGSGHVYFTLRDAGSELTCVMWRSAAIKLKFQPADGLEVIATGGVEVFEKAGRYQLYVRSLEPRGLGALELAFRQLYEKLSKEGLFDLARKRPLPGFPRRIAVVTSPTGAAIMDILRTLRRRFPCVEVLVYAVRVQGEGAAAEIAAAVRRLNAGNEQLGGIDVMIVGRGGGSLEDLWAFNEEIVARAILQSQIPVICGIGHEVDVTIADLVADVRAATPTAAAELAVPVLSQVMGDLASHALRLIRSASQRVLLAAARFQAVNHRPALREPRSAVFRREQLVDAVSHRMHRALSHRLHAARRRLERIEPLLERVAPHAFCLRAAQRLGRVAAKLQSLVSHRLADRRSRVRHLGELLPVTMSHRLALMAEQLRGRQERLSALSYRSVLGRGFSITRTKRGRLIRSVREARDQLRVVTEVADGRFESEVIGSGQLPLFDSPSVEDRPKIEDRKACVDGDLRSMKLAEEP